MVIMARCFPIQTRGPATKGRYVKGVISFDPDSHLSAEILFSRLSKRLVRATPDQKFAAQNKFGNILTGLQSHDFN